MYYLDYFFYYRFTSSLVGWKESNEVEVMEIKVAQTTLKEISQEDWLFKVIQFNQMGVLQWKDPRPQGAIYYDNMVILKWDQFCFLAHQ